MWSVHQVYCTAEIPERILRCNYKELLNINLVKKGLSVPAVMEGLGSRRQALFSASGQAKMTESF